MYGNLPLLIKYGASAAGSAYGNCVYYKGYGNILQ